MTKKQISTPNHTDWRVGDIVSVGTIKNLEIVAALHDDRCSTFALISKQGVTYRYAPPLKLFRTN